MYVCMFKNYMLKLGTRAHTCNPSPGEAEAGGSRIQSHPQLHREFEAGLGCELPCLKEEKKKEHSGIHTDSSSSLA